MNQHTSSLSAKYTDNTCAGEYHFAVTHSTHSYTCYTHSIMYHFVLLLHAHESRVVNMYYSPEGFSTYTPCYLTLFVFISPYSISLFFDYV